ncbi:hypothetical protein CR513_25704, partial [Mucuna pruriens]
MLGLGRKIVEHKLPLLLDSILLRRMKPEVVLKIKEEVEKQWNTGFFLVAKYPQWVANIVPVSKKDEKVWMDLNKASPKDNFPLSHIDMLVDNTAEHAFFSFIDSFSRYNQIQMSLEDREKTMFITLWDTFYYKVMTFRLKNAGTTYQRAMVALFHDMMHKEIEVYMDDMIVKSKTLGQHMKDLWKLNPAKCAFGVKSRKLLSFVVNERGIEVDLDKVKAIREMSASRTKSESKLYSPFHLPANSNMRANVQAHLQKTKDGLEFGVTRGLRKDKKVFRKTSRPRPSSTREARNLILNGARRVHGLCLRIARCHRKERTGHLLTQQIIYRLLRQYMLAHTTWLISKTDPIKYIFEKLALMGRIER